MRLINKKLLLTLLIVGSILAMGTAVFANEVVINFPADDEPVHAQNTLFCAEHGKITALDDQNGNPEEKMFYVQTGESNEIEPSTGYGFWKVYADGENYNSSINSLQHIVWMSRSWGNDSNVLEADSKEYQLGTGTSLTPNDNLNAEYRSHQYGTVYYNIFSKLGNSDLFKTTTSSDNLKVLVDQVDKTYTVGPYNLSLNVDGASDESKQILYNELIGTGNQGYTTANQFAKMSKLAGINGTNIKFVNSKGEEIAFPNFVTGEEFFIRFTPNNDGSISNTEKPEITVDYIKGFNGNVKNYIVSKLQYTYTYKNGEIDDSSVGVTRTDYHEDRNYEGKVINRYVSYQEGYATVKGTLRLTGNDGSVFNVPVEKGGVYVYRNGDSGDWYLKSNTQETYIVDTNAYGITLHIQKTDVIEQATGTNQVPVWASTKFSLPGKEINEVLGGNVWKDLPDVKTGNFSGVKGNEDSIYAGMLVQLFDTNGKLFGTTTTDSNGKYQFTALNPLRKYYVRFTYNGQMYQSTYYKNQLTGGYSNAKDEGREAFNKKFENIDSTAENYKTDAWHKSYALEAKLARDNGEFISYNGGALKYQDAWNKFVEYATNQKSYDSAYTSVESWLSGLGVGSTDRAGVIQFMKDSMITSTTHVTDSLSNKTVEYPVYNQFVLENLSNPTDDVKTITLNKTYYYLYTKKSDQSRYVDYGITLREQADLAIQKDVYKATVIVNGKKQEYKYSKKDSNMDTDGSWDITVRASDELYNGSYTYSREVRKSEYLYNGNSVGTDDAKNLQVYVTYRIAVKNQGAVNTKVNEIVDYYDASQYDFDGTLQSDGKYSITSYNNYDSNGNTTSSYVNSYVGDRTANKTSDITVSSKTSFPDRASSKTLTNGEYSYSSLYLTGMKSTNGSDAIAPGDVAFTYVTFKVKTDPATGKIKLDQDINTGNETIGKRNIVEINGYSTYYVNGATIPDYLDASNGRKDAGVGGKTAGLVDKDSNAGNLSTIDLKSNGDIRTSTSDQVENRIEDDTDKAPNIKVVIERNPDNERKVNGYTYEDARTNTNDDAVVGNGIYKDGEKDANGNKETKISGVTVQLVELVQNVDSHGISYGTYSGEHVWSSMTYDTTSKSWSTDSSRYFSGNGKAKVILSGSGILKVDSYDIRDGEYAYTSLPTGDFFIRFVYGDTSQTVLTNNTESEVNKLLGVSGLNAKSYNGQDYKSTVYQSGITTDGSYNGINGYTNKDGQNYTNSDGTINNGTDKSSMYWYNIDASSKISGASDAKDVYSYRQKANNYSSTLQNNNAEVLDSFDKIGTYKYTKSDGTADNDAQKRNQISMLDTLINNTQMVAQTGIIDTEVECNTQNTDNQGNGNHIAYTIGDVDLGLTERPESQLKLTKQVSNLKISLANSETLFDTNQSVNNLYFAKHKGHNSGYIGFRMSPASVNSSNTTEKPELIQTYIDDELMEGATIRVTYNIKVENVGEVDYLDKTFYYTGKTANKDTSNISTTDTKSIVDYVSNMIKYDKNYQDTDANWDVKTASDLTNSVTKKGNGITIDESKLDNDLVNREYYDNLTTYNTVLTTGNLSKGLLPECIKKDSSISTTLVVSTLLSANNSADNLVYNNLTEIIQSANSQGRRMQYSIAGNQAMSDQSLGNNAKTSDEGVYTTVDLVTPSEIDADSAQKVVLLPPTGENKNYIPYSTALIIASMLIAGIIVVIKKKVLRK